MAASDKMPGMIYKRNTHLAKSFFDCMMLRDTMAKDKAERFTSRAKAENERKIEAMQKALASMQDDDERALIYSNLFRGVPMGEIDLPFSVRTMKRIRAEYVRKLAQNMGEL